MAPRFIPLHGDFVAEVEGVALQAAQDPETVAAISEAIDRYAVLVFRDQPLDDASQLAFTLNFGEIERGIGTVQKDTTGRAYERRVGTGINDISNLDVGGNVQAADDRRRLFNLANQLWHSDSSYKSTPAKFSLLSARDIAPDSGDTQFADMRAAYDALSPELREIVADLVVEHSVMYSREVFGMTDYDEAERRTFAPVLQRLVRTHPRTGRKSLFLSSHAGAIRGWLVPEARALLRELTEHATQREFVHAHRWRVNDLVMWDNRTTMHRATRQDPRKRRDVRRTTVAGDGPTV
jgi:alpha-ketoglutarate-dependent 2,4-dichlorophenoxyacetate dioxygenase